MQFKFKFKFKALFRVDINHTYNTSSNELLKSTMAYNKHTIMHTNILNKNIHQFMQFNISTEQKQAKNKRLMHLSNNRK